MRTTLWSTLLLLALSHVVSSFAWNLDLNGHARREHHLRDVSTSLAIPTSLSTAQSSSSPTSQTSARSTSSVASESSTASSAAQQPTVTQTSSAAASTPGSATPGSSSAAPTNAPSASKSIVVGTTTTNSDGQIITSVVTIPATETPTSSDSPIPTSPSSEDSGGIGTGTVIGLSVAGGCAVLLIIGFFVWKCTRKRFSGFDDDEAIKWPELPHEEPIGGVSVSKPAGSNGYSQIQDYDRNAYQQTAYHQQFVMAPMQGANNSQTNL